MAAVPRRSVENGIVWFHQIYLILIWALRYQIDLNVQIDVIKEPCRLQGFYSGNKCYSGYSILQLILFRRRFD